MPKHEHSGMGEFDHPISEIAESVRAHMAQGHECYQKFTCSHCGQRLVMSEPNKLYTEGKCDQCNLLTDITKSGCNFLLVMKKAHI